MSFLNELTLLTKYGLTIPDCFSPFVLKRTTTVAVETENKHLNNSKFGKKKTRCFFSNLELKRCLFSEILSCHIFLNNLSQDYTRLDEQPGSAGGTVVVHVSLTTVTRV